MLDTKLTWDLHIRNTIEKARQRFYELRQDTFKATYLPDIHLTDLAVDERNMELGNYYTHKQNTSTPKQNT